MPAITGKLEREYEGELRGAETVGREIIRLAVARTFDAYYEGANLQQIVQWFDLGGSIGLDPDASTADLFDGLRQIQGLMEKLQALEVKPKDSPELVVSAAEFVLEGLYAHKRIGRNEERVFVAGEKPARRVDITSPERGGDEPPVRGRRPYN